MDSMGYSIPKKMDENHHGFGCNIGKDFMFATLEPQQPMEKWRFWNLKI